MVISWNSNFETVFSCCWLRRANGKALWGLPFGLAPRLPASARGFKCNKNRRKLNWKNLTNFFHPWVSPKGFFSRKFGKQELRNYDFAVWLFTVKLFIGQTQIALLQNGLLRFNEKKTAKWIYAVGNGKERCVVILARRNKFLELHYIEPKHTLTSA